jgi:uncharacterized phosphosugar-binding protein
MLAEGYFGEMRSVLKKIEETQIAVINEAAAMIVESVTNGGTWNLFDTGHMLMHEAVGRAGGLMMVTPIFVELKATHPARFRPIPPNANRMFMDQVRDIPQFVLSQAQLQAGDVLMIGSVSGVNVMSVEMARLGREMGLKIIAITSVEASKQLEPRHETGLRLFNFADIVLDNCAPYGDALVEVAALDGQRICPASGIATSYLNWAVQASVVEKLTERGLRPSAYLSNHLPGAGEFNAQARKNYNARGY